MPDLEPNQISTSGELVKALEERQYVVRFGAGKKQTRIHRGPCASMRTQHAWKSDGALLGRGVERQRYFVYGTLDGAYQKYADNQSSCLSNPYCNVCLSGLRKEWVNNMDVLIKANAPA